MSNLLSLDCKLNSSDGLIPVPVLVFCLWLFRRGFQFLNLVNKFGRSNNAMPQWYNTFHSSFRSSCACLYLTKALSKNSNALSLFLSSLLSWNKQLAHLYSDLKSFDSIVTASSNSSAACVNNFRSPFYKGISTNNRIRILMYLVHGL